MFLKIQTKKHGNWTYQIKRRFACHLEKQSYDETFSNSDFNFSSFEEDTVSKWKESNDRIFVFIMTFLDEDLNEVVIATDESVDIYLLNNTGKTIDIINRAR